MNNNNFSIFDVTFQLINGRNAFAHDFGKSWLEANRLKYIYCRTYAIRSTYHHIRLSLNLNMMSSLSFIFIVKINESQHKLWFWFVRLSQFDWSAWMYTHICFILTFIYYCIENVTPMYGDVWCWFGKIHTHKKKHKINFTYFSSGLFVRQLIA